MWKDFDATFKSILDDLKRQCDLLDRVAAAQHMAQSQHDSQSLKDLCAEHAMYVKQYKLDRDKLRCAAEEVEKERARNHRDEVLKWISSATMSDLHEQYCKKRQFCPGSGRWILKKEKIEGWKDEEIPTNSILWMHGIPGAGKSLKFLALVGYADEPLFLWNNWHKAIFFRISRTAICPDLTIH